MVGGICVGGRVDIGGDCCEFKMIVVGRRGKYCLVLFFVMFK